MFDLVSNNPMIQLSARGMTLAGQRMALVASNLANIDTPGYRTKDFDFEAAFKAEMEKLDRQFRPTPGQPREIAGPVSTPPIIHPIDIKDERNDGNDVHLDRETAALAKTQATYQFASNLAQTELRLVMSAIRDAAK
ncbi:MAG TPA: flagellar basal body rod protein FlgB [Holophaga sp.]|nr:flagellar basal body rod protein FlgB [Holophaga sp.]